MGIHRKTLAKSTQMLGVAALFLGFTTAQAPSHVYAMPHIHQVHHTYTAMFKNTSWSSTHTQSNPSPYPPPPWHPAPPPPPWHPVPPPPPHWHPVPPPPPHWHPTPPWHPTH